ncbi:MAG: thiamine phosphate synthase [Gemmatimonadaceae bacterium]|nr:thiamine phosphate synthase [Gemmatimonadaceae bacterium]
MAAVLDADVLRLVAITDSLRDGIDGLAGRAAAAVRGGATMVQLRLPDESPRVLAEAARALRDAVSGVPLLVVDRADVALATGADGVHVGSDGILPAALRRVVPDGFIIGVSVGADDDLVRVSGADYAGIGPVFVAGGASAGSGAIGVERFQVLAQQCGVPAVAIGGIAPHTAGAAMAAGAAGVAVISALFGAADPMQAARALRSALDATGR